MTHARFLDCAGPFAAGELATRIGARLSDQGAAALVLRDIAELESAEPDTLSVFSDARYRAALRETRAGVVVTSDALAAHAANGTVLMIAAQPRLAFAQIGLLFHPAPAAAPGIDPGARIDPSAAIGPGCRIEPGVVIGPGAEIGARSHVGANAVIGRGVVIGADCRIGANSAIDHAVIGARVAIGSCVSIGGPGFGFVPGPAGLVRTPQLGRVVIEDGVTIDANCAIDRGAHGDTVIGAGTVIDNLVHVAHNVRIGRFCVVAGQTGIAGSTAIGDGVVIGAQAGISDHLTIGAGARIAAKSGVIRDVDKGDTVGGYPALPIRQWHRQTAGLIRLFRRKSAKD